MAAPSDIAGWFVVLSVMVDKLAGEGLPPAEQEQIKILAKVALHIAESVVMDLNRIADAAQHEASR